jgi:hypothetical protein
MSADPAERSDDQEAVCRWRRAMKWGHQTPQIVGRGHQTLRIAWGLYGDDSVGERDADVDAG